MVKLKRLADEGFTLVEMLIVVILLGIVATIAVISLGNVNDSSQITACRTDFQTVSAALAAYKNDNSAALSADKNLYQPSASNGNAIASPLIPNYMVALSGGRPDGLYEIALASSATDSSGYQVVIQKVTSSTTTQDVRTDFATIPATPDDCKLITK